MDADRLEQLADAATPGPWEWKAMMPPNTRVTQLRSTTARYETYRGVPVGVLRQLDYMSDRDRDLIALAPTLARDHAALLRWAEKAAKSLEDIYIALELWQEGRTLNRPYVRLRIGEAKALLAALDDLRTTP